MSNTTLVIIPTYNEVENLPLIVDRVLNSATGVDVLVVDDNSPDGTGAAAAKLSAQHAEVHVLERTGKEGLLAAYRAGFRWGLERGYEVLCQMDADGSHAPEELSRLLESIEDGADLVIGSRYIDGGEVKNWQKQRLLLSKLGNWYISAALDDDVRDMTAGYRAIRREVLEAIDLDALSPKGYIFQAELAHKAINEGFDVREVPVTFEDRRLGESKLDASFAASSLAEVTRWSVKEKVEMTQDLFKHVTALAKHEFEHSSRRPALSERINHTAKTLTGAVGAMSDLARHELKRAGLLSNQDDTDLK